MTDIGESVGTREGALARIRGHYDSGGFIETLARRVAVPSTSQDPDFAPHLWRYLDEEITPAARSLGFEVRVDPNPEAGGGPLLTAVRQEDAARPTVLIYGHGDTVLGHEGLWRDGRDPWTLDCDGEKLYGRGVADNKGQHSIALAALEAVLAERGRFGFNAKLLVETSEETGSKGLRAFAGANRERLAADVLIASDGPRVAPDRPTVFLGSRGVVNYALEIAAREGGHHSGNWGGLLSNPATRLANALSGMVDARGRILVEGLRPPPMSNAVRTAIAACAVDGGPGAPQIDPDWGEPGLTPWERVFGWNALEVLAWEAGDAAQPVNAIPPRARAVIQMRFVADSDEAGFLPAIRAHLDAHGFGDVQVSPLRTTMKATRTPLDDPWVRRVMVSLETTLGQSPALLPNLGGSIPNDVFTDVLGMPTIWIPHSFAGCSQHAPNEHVLAPLLREGLEMMTGIFWDIGA
ncbi:MAG: M20 family metallopeptidase [Alphaproteobacteria bacterium]|nr:M20 family metallopeptidase [Alphaproteobacteria bacterium]